MVFREGCGSGRGEFDMLMQENAVRRRKGGEEGLRASRVGLLGKWLWQGTRQPGPSLGKEKRVCVHVRSRLCEDLFQF